MPRAATAYALGRPARGLWTPELLAGAGLCGWHDASDVSTIDGATPYINQWADKSPLQRHATVLEVNQLEYAPTRLIGGLPTVRQYPYAGISAPRQYDAYALPSKRTFAMFAVFRTWAYSGGAAIDGSGTYIWDRYDSPASGGMPLFSLKVDSNTNSYMLQIRDDSGDGIDGSPIITGVRVGVPELFSLEARLGAGGRVEFVAHRAGELVTQTLTWCYNITLDTFRWGYPSGNGYNADVDNGEWLMLNRTPSTGERQRIEGYLAHKWSIPLHGAHPYATRAPTLFG